MALIQLLDRLIPYDIFLNDLATRIVKFLKLDNSDPEFISQRRAYEMSGCRNVERWRRMGKMVAYKRPGKVEYRAADLRLLQCIVQDYFDKDVTKDDLERR